MIDFKALFEHSPNAYMLLDRAFRYVHANSAYLALTGAPLDALLGRSLFDLFPHDPTDPENASVRQLRGSFERVLKTGHPDHIALISYRVGGRERHWSATHTPLFDGEGRVQYILQHTMDVTDDVLSQRLRTDVPPELVHSSVLQRARHVQEENVLLDAERLHLRRLFQQAPGFMAFLRGPTHIFELANDAYYGVVGRREIIGKPVREALPEVEGQGYFELLDQVYREGKTFVGRGMFVNVARLEGDLDGVYLDLIYQPVFDSAGKVTGIFVQGHDVTEMHKSRQELQRYRDHLEELVKERTRALEESEAERRRAEEELRQAQKMEAVGKLTGGVAHDFNNLLQVIGGNLQLLHKEIVPSARALQRLKNASEAVARGGKLAAQLLAFARRQPLEPVPLHLGNVLRRMDDLLTRAVGEHISVQFRAAADLGNTLVDPNQLENVILNLVINARDAMAGEGRLLIDLANATLGPSLARDVPPGDYVVLSITDDGCGMSPEVAQRVFEPFFTTKPIGQGSGLGLSMVYGFVKQSGGHVELTTEPGQGTTFRIFLPRTLELEAAAPEQDNEPVERGTETLLVVEDDAAVRQTVVATLSDLGYQVLEAEDAEGAVELLRQGARVDLLFTDVVMPGPLRSTELAAQARALLPELEVVFTSGYTQDAIVQDGKLEAGVSLLSKPYTREQLARKVRQALRQRAARQNADAGEPLKLLVVEDNQDIRSAVAEVLRDLGHHVTEAGTAEAARNALSANGYDVLFTDVKLPAASGLELAQEAVRSRPKLRVIIATGDSSAQRRCEESGLNAVVLPKPFDLDQIAQAMDRVRMGLAG